MILEPPSPPDAFVAPRPPSAEFLQPPLLRKSSSGECGLAIELIKNLALDNAPVSNIMMAESSDAGNGDGPAGRGQRGAGLAGITPAATRFSRLS